jgi:Tol biopolymer transport system component
MTMPTRLERNLPGILDELSAAPTSEYLDDVLARTARTRQRPAWTFPERWFPMADITRPRAFAFAPPLRTIAVALVLLALLVAAAALYVGSQPHRVPAPFGPAGNGLIAYETSGDIYAGDPVTGESRLVVGGIPNDDHDPGFSPDGTQIAFLRSDGLSDVDLYVVRPDGSDLKRVTASPLPADAWVNWAPDSRHFGVIRLENGHKRFDLIGVDGGSPRQLAPGMDMDQFTYRPPLAQEILFRAIVDGGFGLYVMKADGTDIRELVTTPNPADYSEDLNRATYSADGTRIFYQRWFPDSIQLWVMNADGSDQHRFDTQVEPSWSGQASVSPDGRWIAYWHSFNDRATQRLSVLRADGTGPLIQTGPELKGVVDYGWAPDSSRILMTTSDPADSPGHYLLDPAGGPWTKIGWQSTSVADWQRLAP